MPTFTKFLKIPKSRVEEWPVGIDYSYIPVDEAVGILAHPTGDDRRDFLHTILIDLLQRGYIRSVRSPGDDPPLRHVATEAGRQYSHVTLGLPE